MAGNRNSFTFCQRQATTPTPPGVRQCHTFESDLFTTDGTCLGVQSFPGTDDCPIDFPTPLSRSECEDFASTPRPTWVFLKDPTFGGEVNEADRPGGCLKSASGNQYVWNVADPGSVGGSGGWHV